MYVAPRTQILGANSVWSPASNCDWRSSPGSGPLTIVYVADISTASSGRESRSKPSAGRTSGLIHPPPHTGRTRSVPTSSENRTRRLRLSGCGWNVASKRDVQRASTGLPPQLRAVRRWCALPGRSRAHRAEDTHGHLVGDLVLRITAARLPDLCNSNTLLAPRSVDHPQVGTGGQRAMTGFMPRP